MTDTRPDLEQRIVHERASNTEQVATGNRETSDGAGSGKTNEMGPAGESADPLVGRPVSGQPAGGPDDLGSQASDNADLFETADPLGAGINACASGIARRDCPYPTEGDEGRLWLEGWDRQRGR